MIITSLANIINELLY